MGFKVDSSFLKFLTMGALSVRRVARELTDRGFSPVILERYSASNKIWATKVKRLRLPDLFCVNTGMRVEVRAKTNLTIRMSDAPNNPDRAWDAGLRDEDIVALIACTGGGATLCPADNAVYFSVRSLRESVDNSSLGAPKSASEGAERDRTWPSVVPSRPGQVLSVTTEKLVVRMEGDGAPPRNQTYTLNGKSAYVVPEARFAAGTTILAGAPHSLANLDAYHNRIYQPLEDIVAPNALDRYAAVKALRFRDDLHQQALPALEAAIGAEREIRVALEAAGSAAALGSAMGEERIATILRSEDAADMSMEAILILSELQTPFAHAELCRVAGDARLHGDERRQAAIWGLGKSGHRTYRDLVPFIGDVEDNVAYHAISAFGPDASEDVIQALIGELLMGDPRRAPGASEALRVIGAEGVLKCLINAIEVGVGNQDWLLATIGRLPPNMVRAQLQGAPLLERLAPLLLLAPGANWLRGEDASADMAFLLKQAL